MIGEKVSHYRIIEKLGGGGMGIIYKAQDLKLDRFVALKFLPPAFSMNEDFKQNIIEEAKIAATLDHPNICNIHEVGETEDEQIFIAMALYEGETLKKKIQNNSIDKNDIESIVLQIAKGLEQAHEKGIVHRDIKPDNIFITKQNEVKILDFGVAKIAGDFSVMDADKVKGTLAYMSPEQISGNPTDNRTDIWAFGVLLYELITGEKPFSSQYEQSALFSIVNDEPDYSKFSELVNQLYLKDIVQKCLKKNKDDRFQTVSEVFAYIINSSQQIQFDKKLFNRFLVRKNTSKILLFIIALILTVLILIIWSLLSSNNVKLKSPDYVLVSNFENHTDEEIFDYSLSEAMAITLRQSPYFNIFPRNKISHTLSLMKIDPNSKIDRKLAIQIGKRESIPAIIAGEINKNNNKYIITASLINTIEEEKISLHVEKADNLENILEAMDKLATKIREDLGESAQSLFKYSLPLAQVTTSSIEALDLYSRGDILENFGKYSEATKFKEEALLIDTLFVKAISDLSYNYYKIGNLQKAVKFHNKILPLIDLVSEHEKLSMLTVYYGPTFEMDYPKAFEYAKKWTLLYPNDAYGYAHLGHLAMFAGDFQIAINSNKRALELDSSISGTLFNNTGYAYALNGNGTKAIENFKKSQSIRPDYFNIDLFMGRTYWMTNQLDSAIKHFKIALTKSSGIEQAKVQSHIISHYHLVGQIDNAITACNQAISICRDEERSDEEAYFHYLKGELEFEAGNYNEYFIEMDESERLSESPFFEYALIGLSFAKNGYPKRGERLLSKIRNIISYDPHFVNRLDSYVNFIQGRLSISEKKYKEGIQYFEKVKKLYSGDPIFLMAQNDIAFNKKMINKPMAIRNYNQILENYGELFMSYLPTVRKCGLWIGKIYFDSNYELGLLFSELNDRTNAVRYLEKTKKHLMNSTVNDNKLNNLNQILKKMK